MSGEKRDGNEPNVLVDIGACGLHANHGAFKYSNDKSDWKLNYQRMVYFSS